MSHPSSATFYRHLIRESLQLAWQRKRLWIFGLGTALISTGGIMEVAGRSLGRIRRGSDWYERVMDGSFSGFRVFGEYVRQLRFLDTTQAAVLLALFVLIGIFVVIIAVRARASLLVGLRHKKDLTLGQAWQNSRSAFWPFLALNILAKITMWLLITLTTLPLISFVSTGSLTNALVYCLTFLLFFPAIVITQLIFTLAQIDYLEQPGSISKALRQAARLFSKQWLVTLELGIIIFLLVFAVGLVLMAVLMLAAVPYVLLVLLAALSGVPFLFLLVQMLGFIGLATILLCYLGAAVVFQHAVWVEFYRQATGKITAKKVVAKLERLWAKI